METIDEEAMSELLFLLASQYSDGNLYFAGDRSGLFTDLFAKATGQAPSDFVRLHTPTEQDANKLDEGVEVEATSNTITVRYDNDQAVKSDHFFYLRFYCPSCRSSQYKRATEEGDFPECVTCGICGSTYRAEYEGNLSTSENRPKKSVFSCLW